MLVSSDLQVRGLEVLRAYVTAELNLGELHVQTADRNDTKLEATPDARLLGKRLGGKYKAVAAAIKTLPSLAVRQVSSPSPAKTCCGARLSFAFSCLRGVWGRSSWVRACCISVHVARAPANA